MKLISDEGGKLTLTEHLLREGLHCVFWSVVSQVNLNNSPAKYYQPTFTSDETEIQRGQVIFPRLDSHHVEELYFELRSRGMPSQSPFYWLFFLHCKVIVASLTVL